MIAYLVNIVVLFSINAILAMTLNFIMGYAGIFSLAHAIFFGVGAYTAAFIAINFTDSLLICMAGAMALSGLLSLALALPALRVRGEYFVAASLGLQVIGVTVFSEWHSVTGGLAGMVGIPPPRIGGFTFTDPLHFVALALVSLLAVLAVIALLVRGSFGRSLMAIRDSESATQAYGKHVNAVKTLSVVVAAALTYLPFLPAEELGTAQQIIYGAAMVLLMMFRPGGLVSARIKERRACPPFCVSII